MSLYDRTIPGQKSDYDQDECIVPIDDENLENKTLNLNKRNIHHLNLGILKKPGNQPHLNEEDDPTKRRQKAYKTQISAPLPPQQISTEGNIRSVKFKDQDENYISQSKASQGRDRQIKKHAFSGGIKNNHSKNHDSCFRRSKSYKRGDFEKAALNFLAGQDLQIIREESRGVLGYGDQTPADHADLTPINHGDVGGSIGGGGLQAQKKTLAKRRWTKVKNFLITINRL